jgi:hypothetical protein
MLVRRFAERRRNRRAARELARLLVALDRAATEARPAPVLRPRVSFGK